MGLLSLRKGNLVYGIYLEDEALEDGEGRGSCCVQAEDDIIEKHRIDASWVPVEILILEKTKNIP